MYCLLTWIKLSVKKTKTLKKILEKWKQILEKCFVSPEKWEPCVSEDKFIRKKHCGAWNSLQQSKMSKFLFFFASQRDFPKKF